MYLAGPDFAGFSRTRKALLVCCSTLAAIGVLGLGVVHSNSPALGVTVAPSAPVAKAAQLATAVRAGVVTETPRTTSAPPVAPTPPNVRGAVPAGKGMWLYLPERTEGGNPQAIVARAQRVGLTHIYVRTGSSKTGFYAGPFLDALLPVAHAAGIRVYGWDFPYLDDPAGDVVRGLQAIKYGTPGGERIDGFAADIELRSQGVNITPFTAAAYGASLRHEVGDNYPLIAVVPRPNALIQTYPYEQVTAAFDAIAPMIYWLTTDPKYAVDLAFDRLGGLGKPIIPVGQAYDAFHEGGPAGVPSPAMIQRFMEASAARGASAVSFWSWQHANDPAWQVIQDSPMFQLPVAPLQAFRADQIRAYQVLLNSLGFGVTADGRWGPQSQAAVRAFQSAAHLPVSGVIDAATRLMLLRPINPPLK